MGRAQPEASSIDSKTEVSTYSDIILWTMLVLCPLLTAIGEFQTSKLSQTQSINPYFQPFCCNALMMVFFGALAIMEQGPLPQKLTTWLLLTVVWALSTLGAMLLKVIAFRNDKITRVYPIYYCESVICLLFDLLIFQV
jgi:drug/metabolite transporter (DMT)-like permease